MYRATLEISHEFERENIRHDVREDEGTGYSYVDAQFKLKVGTGVSVKFISQSDKNDCGVRVFSLARIPGAKIKDALKFINEKNRQYSYVKFDIDDDGDVNMEYDLPMRCVNLGPCAVEMLYRFAQIIEEVLPELMRLIWA